MTDRDIRPDVGAVLSRLTHAAWAWDRRFYSNQLGHSGETCTQTGDAGSPVLAPSLPLDDDLGEDAAHPVPSIIREAVEGNCNTPAPLLSPLLDAAQHTSDPIDPSTPVDSYEQTWKRLISHAVPQGELPSLIETIFSDRKRTDMVNRLQKREAQAFVDMIDGVSHQTLYFQPEGIVGSFVTQTSTFYWSGIK